MEHEIEGLFSWLTLVYDNVEEVEEEEVDEKKGNWLLIVLEERVGRR